MDIFISAVICQFELANASEEINAIDKLLLEMLEDKVNDADEMEERNYMQ